jgi:hypothetical protein
LFAENVSSDAAINAFQARYRKLYPREAQQVLVGHVYDINDAPEGSQNAKRSQKRNAI